jgi:hypothetical protein
LAIKGKRRSRGGRTSVGTAPRPQYVVPRKPLFKRTGVRVFLILIVLAGVITGLVVGLNVRDSNRRKEAAQQDVREFQIRVEAALTAEAVGQAQATSVLILPELGQTISELQAGQIKKGKVKETREKLTKWNTDAKEAAEKVAVLDTGATEYAKDLSDTRGLIQQSLLIYAGLAQSVGIALDLEGQPRETLIQNILEQYPTAATVFDSAWRRLQTIRTELEIPQAAGPGALPGGIPGGVPGGVPGGIPGGVPGGIPGGVPGGVPAIPSP